MGEVRAKIMRCNFHDDMLVAGVCLTADQAWTASQDAHTDTGATRRTITSELTRQVGACAVHPLKTVCAHESGEDPSLLKAMVVTLLKSTGQGSVVVSGGESPAAQILREDLDLLAPTPRSLAINSAYPDGITHRV